MNIGVLIYGSLDTISGGYLYDRKLVEYLQRQGDVVEIISLPWRNYARHLGNDRLLSLIHEARVAFLADRGMSEWDCGGVSLIIADIAIVFQGEAFAGDVLRFEVAAGEPGRSGFRLFFRVTRASDTAPIALVENGVVCFDYRTQKIQPLPDAVHAMCSDLGGSR